MQWLVHQVHYSDVIMGTVASQVTILTIVYSTIYRSKKTSKLRVTGLCAGNSPGTAFTLQIESLHMAFKSDNIVCKPLGKSKLPLSNRWCQTLRACKHLLFHSCVIESRSPLWRSWKMWHVKAIEHWVQDKMAGCPFFRHHFQIHLLYEDFDSIITHVCSKVRVQLTISKHWFR